MRTDKMRAKERGLLLGTISLVIYLCLIILPTRYLGYADFSLRLGLQVLVALRHSQTFVVGLPVGPASPTYYSTGG